MRFAMPNLTPALPEIFVLIMASLILVVDLFLSGKNRFVSYALTQFTLLGAAWITVSTSSQDVGLHLQRHVRRRRRWPTC